MSRRVRSEGGRRSRMGRTVIGALVAVAVLGLLGWVGYQYFLTNMLATSGYRQQVAALRGSWAATPTEPSGDASGESDDVFAVLRIPALGNFYQVPVLHGTERAVLDRGVGHYPSSALPGQVGNCALAGLRVTHGQPFARLHELDRGDQVVLETRRSVFTYVLDVAPRDLTVRSNASWVLQPVPGRPGARPTQALLTLTTAQDVLATGDRTVGIARLASTQNKG